MANTQYICEQKNFKKCEEPRRDFSIPGFNGVLCKNCWGVVSYTKVEEPKKIKVTKKQLAEGTIAKELIQEEALMEAAALDQEKSPLVELPVIGIPEVPVVKETAQGKPTTLGEAEIVIAKVSLIKKMEEEKFPAVDILLELKSQFGLTNAAAGAFLKEYRAKNAPVVIEEVAVAQAEPETIPHPLPEKEAKERKESPIKPQEFRTIDKTQKPFPIVKFELDEADRSYKMYLATEDGMEFMFRQTPQAEKYERAKLNPGQFIGLSILLEYSEIDDSDIPQNPVFAGIKPGPKK